MADTHATRMLTAIELLLEGKATADVAEYQINGRSLKRYSIPDLLKLRALYKKEVAAEARAEALADGNKPGIVRVFL